MSRYDSDVSESLIESKLKKKEEKIFKKESKKKKLQKSELKKIVLITITI